MSEQVLLSFLIGLLFIFLISGLSALLDRIFLALVVWRSGPVIGFGFLTILADGYKLISKNPWSSSPVLLVGIIFYSLEVCFTGWIPIWQIPGSLLLCFLGLSGILIVIGSSQFYRGYSTWGRNRIHFQILIGEGVLILLFYLLLFISSYDFLYFVEEDKSSIISELQPSLIMILIFFLFLFERHPGDLPESESECGGGPGINYSAISFMAFAILEYRWILYLVLLGYLFQCVSLYWFIILFVMRGIFPRFDWKSYVILLKQSSIIFFSYLFLYYFVIIPYLVFLI